MFQKTRIKWRKDITRRCQIWLLITFLKINRSSYQRFSVKKDVLRNFAKFTEKHLCQGLFLIKLQSLGLRLYYKGDSGTGVFLWILQNFKEYLFYRTPLDNCFCNKGLPDRLTSNVKLLAEGTPFIFSVAHDISLSAIEVNEDLNKIKNWVFKWMIMYLV